jgi:hypothetical protein
MRHIFRPYNQEMRFPHSSLFFFSLPPGPPKMHAFSGWRLSPMKSKISSESPLFLLHLREHPLDYPQLVGDVLFTLSAPLLDLVEPVPDERDILLELVRE